MAKCLLYLNVKILNPLRKEKQKQIQDMRTSFQDIKHTSIIVQLYKHSEK